MDRAPVTIIVPTYNRAHFLPECLDSLVGQTLPPQEIIVVDDGSSDETPDVVRAYGPPVELIRKKNGGKSDATNVALEKASGEFVWIFDDDDAALPDALASHMAAFEARPDIGFTYGNFIWAESDDNGRIRALAEQKMPEVSSEELFVRLLEDCFFRLSATVVRASCLRAVGNFRRDLIRSQDYDMQLRLAARFHGFYTGRPTLYARQHSGARGGAGDSHSAAMRALKHLSYDRIIIRKFWEELPLSAYLPRGREFDQLGVARALLQRACVMGRRGFWKEMVSDLRRYVECGASLEPLAPSEQRIAASTLSVTIAIATSEGLLEACHYLRNILRVPRGCNLRLHLSRGLWHSLINAVRDRNLRAAYKAVHALIALLGVAGLCSVLRYRIRLLAQAG